LTPTRRPRFDYVGVFCYLAILLLPFLLSEINDTWIFAKPNGPEYKRRVFIDVWVYSGLHLHLPEFLKRFGGTYYASRVPWTLPGWFLHLIFNDEYARYILHYGVFYLASFSLYYAVRNIFANRTAAFATALAMGTQSYFLYAIGWDYVDGISIAYLLASFAALSSTAIRRHWRFAAIAWGAAICAMVSTYILLVLFVPIEIGMFLLLNRFAGKRSIGVAGGLAVSGGVATTLGLGLINWRLGGEFLYLLAQIKPLSTVAANRFQYDLPPVRWVWTSPWLLLPAILFTFSCLFVCLHHRSVLEKLRSVGSTLDGEISLYICCLADVAASLIFVVLEADHFYVLQIDYRANSLLPFAFLVIGGAFAVVSRPRARFMEFGFPIASTAIALAPWILASSGLVFPRSDLFQTIPMLVLGWVLGGALLLAFLVQRSSWRVGALLLIAFFSIVSVGAPTDSFSFPLNPLYKQETLAIFDASREIARYDADAQARFWFDLNDPQGEILGDVASTYLYAYSLINDAFPRLRAEDGRVASIAPGDRIIVLTSKGDPIPLANVAVADENIVFDQIADISIQRPGVSFRAVVVDAKTDPSKYEEIALPWAVSGPRVGTGPNPKLQGTFPAGVRTPAQPWAYGARFPLQRSDVEGPLFIRIRASVQGGPVGIGILNQDGSDFLSRISVVASEDTTVNLSVPKAELLGDLVIQSWDRGRSGDVTVNGITVLKPHSPMVKQR
jgi:hypothetical protein